MQFVHHDLEVGRSHILQAVLLEPSHACSYEANEETAVEVMKICDTLNCSCAHQNPVAHLLSAIKQPSRLYWDDMALMVLLHHAAC